MDLHRGAEKKQFAFARLNLKDQTGAEDLLLRNLREGRLAGYKFRRQHPLAGFIADFYCHEAALVVEVDGNIHQEAEHRDYDRGRTCELRELGIKVIRFSNEEVLNKVEWVLDEVRKHPG